MKARGEFLKVGALYVKRDAIVAVKENVGASGQAELLLEGGHKLELSAPDAAEFLEAFNKKSAVLSSSKKETKKGPKKGTS